MSLSDEFAHVQRQMEHAAPSPMPSSQQQQHQQQMTTEEERYYDEQQEFAEYEQQQQQQQQQQAQDAQAQQQQHYEQQAAQQHYQQHQQAQSHLPLQHAPSAARPASSTASSARGDYSQQPLRPVVPPYLQPTGVAPPQPQPQPQPPSQQPSPWASVGRAPAAAPHSHPTSTSSGGFVDPRSTPEYQIAWELEVWRRTEQARMEAEWKAAGEARMRVIEEEWRAKQLADEAAHAARMGKVKALEKKLQAGLFELQNQERLLRVQEGDLASRVASLDRELKRVESDAEAKIARAREQAKHEVSKAKASVEEMDETLQKKKQELKACQAKLAAAQVEAEQARSRLAKSTIGELRLALERKELERKRLEEDLGDMVAQRDGALQRLQLALDKACELKHSLDAREAENLALERKDMERLRMAYLAKQESQGLRRDMGELMEIKRQVREHLAASAGPPRPPVTGMPEHRPHGFPVPDWSTAAAAPTQQHPVPMGPHSASAPPPAHSNAPGSASQRGLGPGPHYASFNPLPQTSLSGSARSGVASHASNPAVQANAVPQPYHYFVHEPEVISKVQGEMRASVDRRR